jgi:N-acetylmuramoyl-L-alanine amidase
MILLDYGHGKDTKGKSCKDLQEWRFNRDVGRFIELELINRKICYSVLVTEENDVSLTKRVERSKNISHDLLVSIHGNAFKGELVSGIETWYYSKRGKVVAQIFQKHLVKRLGWKDRGVKQGNFTMIKKTPELAILTENGFYTNDAERAKMLDPYYQMEIAVAHADAIEEFLNLKS